MLFPVLWIELGASRIPGRRSTTKLHLQLHAVILLIKNESGGGGRRWPRDERDDSAVEYVLFLLRT